MSELPNQNLASASEMPEGLKIEPSAFGEALSAAQQESAAVTQMDKAFAGTEPAEEGLPEPLLEAMRALADENLVRIAENEVGFYDAENMLAAQAVLDERAAAFSNAVGDRGSDDLAQMASREVDEIPLRAQIELERRA